MSKSPNDPAAPAPEAAAPPPRKSGRTVFGDDGRGVWEWQTSTGVFSQDITDEQLGRLEAQNLEVMDSHEAQTRNEWTQTSDRIRAAARPIVRTPPKRGNPTTASRAVAPA